VPTHTKQLLIIKSHGSKHIFILAGLFFLSGTAGLILQVVWMYRLGLVFGNAAYATAATLSAFFLGMALGGWFWGKAATRLRNALSIYGLMELGIALSALLWIPGIGLYESNYPIIVDILGNNAGMLTFGKFIFSISLLLLPTLFMGGTFPVLSQYVAENRDQLAIRGTFLYAVNTIGASIGAFIAGFFLLSEYGVSSTYYFAIALAAGTGIIAIVLDRLTIYDSKAGFAKNKSEVISNKKLLPSNSLSYSLIIVLAFSSGLLALSAETIWIKMFAQVLQNSVYSFSAILVVFLIALGCGGMLSHLLVRISVPVIPTIVILLSVGAIMIGVSPLIFNMATNGLQYISASASWTDYLQSIFRLSFLIVFPPTLVIGSVFPYLLKASPKINRKSGSFVGLLVFFNSIGSAVGPLLIGFFFLDYIGLWNSVKVIAIIYVALALLITFYFKKRTRWTTLTGLTVILLILIPNPPLVHLEANESILDIWQSSDGVVSIVESDNNIQMRLDNFYVLGDTRSVLVEKMQAHIPLLLHPEPKSVLFLGMGTGITAGASLDHNVDHIVTVELVPNVIRAAKRYFTPWVNELFTRPNVEIVPDDARNFLLGTSQNFDVIIGDLFTPWHQGTGTLYTVEQFKLAKKHLTSNGIFAQWLPLYQLTPESFKTISATFASVFPQVTLWRADFSTSRASIVLIGQASGTSLDQRVLEKNITNIIETSAEKADSSKPHMAGLFYLGNLQAIKDSLSGIPINTDDKRTIEFNAPVLSQKANSGKASYIVGKEFEKLITALARGLPPQEDPYLSLLPENEIKYVEVGLQYYKYLQLKTENKNNEADSVRTEIQTLAPGFLTDTVKN
jgi:spermidine synthase